MIRTAFVDDCLMAREFSPGDFVRKSSNREFSLSPYVGRVLFSNLDTGKVSVQWNWGTESESASDLIRDVDSGFAPPLLADQSYSTWEKAQWSPRGRKASIAEDVVQDFERATLPVWRAACAEWHRGTPEVIALFRVSAEFDDDFGFDTVRRTIANLYSEGRRLAIYWKDSKRRYRTTQKEKTSGRLRCPRCGGVLKPIVYRHGDKIFQCRGSGASAAKPGDPEKVGGGMSSGCGFSVHPKDVK